MRKSTKLNFKMASRILTDKTSTKKRNIIQKILRKRLIRAARIVLITGILSCSPVAFAADTLPVPVTSANSTDLKNTKLTYKTLKKALITLISKKLSMITWLSTGFFIGFYCLPSCPEPIHCSAYLLSFGALVEIVKKIYFWFK